MLRFTLYLYFALPTVGGGCTQLVLRVYSPPTTRMYLMKTYATIALVISSLVLIGSVLLTTDFARFTLHEIAPFVLGYAVLMTGYALLSYVYIRKRERRRRRHRTTPATS